MHVPSPVPSHAADGSSPSASRRPVTLTIAGSDSSGGAGIQADLRTFRRLDTVGTTAITAVTAQNLDGVTDVDGVRPDLVAAQIAAIVVAHPVAAIKTGMLWSSDIVDAVVEALPHPTVLIVDPVMVATSGAQLLDAAAIKSYGRLFARATLATPNLDEAAVLLGRPTDPSRLCEDAAELADRLGCAVLLKGGHLGGMPIDTLVQPGDVSTNQRWRHSRIVGVNTHGSGCILSAAIAAYSAHGHPLTSATEHGLAFVHDALQRGGARSDDTLANIEHAEARLELLERLGDPQHSSA